MFGCTPLVGRVNGRCLLGEEKCSVPGAECPDGSTVCSCKQGFGVNFHTFTCTGVTSSAVAEEPVNYVALFFVWVSIIALLIVLLIVTAYVYRVSAVHKKCDVMAEFAERRSQIIELQDQVHTLLEEEQVVRTLSAMSMTSNSRTAVEHQDQEHTLLEEEQTDTLLKEKEAGTLL
jgi:ABC-type anion transport system duplicated permease subunit